MTQLQVAGSLAGVAAARRWAADVCRAWVVDDTADTVTLLVSEVVTNAVTHAGRPVVLRLGRSEQRIRVEVRDSGDDELQVRRPDSSDEHGRGLMLLAHLSSAWGVDISGSQGKTVWFEVARS